MSFIVRPHHGFLSLHLERRGKREILEKRGELCYE